MTLNLPLLYVWWLEEYCQTSPNKNKSPNLRHITSILVCCIFGRYNVLIFDESNLDEKNGELIRGFILKEIISWKIHTLHIDEKNIEGLKLFKVVPHIKLAPHWLRTLKKREGINFTLKVDGSLNNSEHNYYVCTLKTSQLNSKASLKSLTWEKFPNLFK